MWGNLINISISFVLLLITPFIANKIAKTKGKRIFASIAIFIALIAIVSPMTVTIENQVMKFKTPESVFNFTHTEEIVDTVYGNDSCMIVYSKGKEGVAQEFILKSGNTYKLPYNFMTKSNFYFAKNNASFVVCNVLGTNDYYIIGSVHTGETPETIVNSKDKQIKFIVSDTIGTAPKTIIFYDVVNEFSIDYYIKINDKTVYAK